MNKNKFYIVTSIPYANAKPHLGHTLDVLYGDVLARYYRSLGYDVILQAGIDENGQKLYQKAKEMGATPENWIKDLRPVFKDFFEKLNISYDEFTQTSEKDTHHVAAQEMWERANKSGDIYKKKYSGLYCVGCESFKLKEDLVDGKCPDHQKEPEKIEEENYFFKLSKYENFLKEHFKKNLDFVYPKNSYNEAMGMLKTGLSDVSISRPKTRLPWGVPVPGDEEHVMYVWFDALTNYLTALGFPKNKEKFEKYWPADVEIVGKDNNRWHTLLWPAMLKSAGLKLPKIVIVHSFIIAKGGLKMSKTIGNVVEPIEIINKYGTDPFRYYLLTRIPMDHDGSFDEELQKQIYETELGNELGNLLQRTISMINKYNIKISVNKPKTIGDCQKELMESFEFSKRLENIWSVIRDGNRFIEDNKPWELSKTDLNKLKEVLQEVYDMLVTVADQLDPFLPDTSDKMKKQLKSLKPEPLFPRIEE